MTAPTLNELHEQLRRDPARLEELQAHVSQGLDHALEEATGPTVTAQRISELCAWFSASGFLGGYASGRIEGQATLDAFRAARAQVPRAFRRYHKDASWCLEWEPCERAHVLSRTRCGAAMRRDPQQRCRLKAGHEGPHQNEEGS